MELYVDYSGAVGKTITLYPVPDGNLHTQSIDYTDFPKIDMLDVVFHPRLSVKDLSGHNSATSGKD